MIMNINNSIFGANISTSTINQYTCFYKKLKYKYICMSVCTINITTKYEIQWKNNEKNNKKNNGKAKMK